MPYDIVYLELYKLIAAVAVVIAVVWYKRRRPKRPDKFVPGRNARPPLTRVIRKGPAETFPESPESGKPSGQKVLFSKAKDEEWEAYKDRIVESLGKRGFLSPESKESEQ